MPKDTEIGNSSIKMPVFHHFKLILFLQSMVLTSYGSPASRLKLKASIYLPLYCLTTSKVDPFQYLHLLMNSPTFLFFIFLFSAFPSQKSFPDIKTQFKCCCLHENILSWVYSYYVYSIRNSLPPLKSPSYFYPYDS